MPGAFLPKLDIMMFKAIAIGALISVCVTVLIGCTNAQVSITPPADVHPNQHLNPVDQAAIEATAIIQQAQATAYILQAHAQATHLVAGIGSPIAVSQDDPPSNTPVPGSPPSASPSIEADQSRGEVPSVQSLTEQTHAPNWVEIIGIRFAAEGKLILVHYKASSKMVDQFWPGRLSLTDEGTGVVYDEVPVMPKIGPLIGRPAKEGQPGYVMFVNGPTPLTPGSLVTVQLAGFKQEHVKVE